MTSTFTTNSYIGSKPIGKSVWPLRVPNSVISPDYKRKQPVASFIYEIRVADIGPAPQRFTDFDRNNVSGAMHESGFQLFVRTTEKVLQAYNDSPVPVPGGYPVEMLLEVVLRPEGEEEVDLKDQESRAARDLMAEFVENFYGKARFNKETITSQSSLFNSAESTKHIEFMNGFDRRRVYAYRFHVFMLNTDVDFSAQMIGVVDISIDLYKRHAGINNDEFAATRRSNKFAKQSNGGGGGGGNNNSRGNDSNDGFRNGNQGRMPSTLPLSHMVTETERWKLIKNFNDYINVVATYLRDETWFDEQKKRELLSKANPFTNATNPLCPLNVFGAQNYFRSAAEKRLPIDEKQLDIANYYSYEKEVGQEKSTIYAKFPYPNLVLRVPIDKLTHGIEVANMFLPDVQKRTIEPHLDLQRSVGAGIERKAPASASQSVGLIEGAGAAPAAAAPIADPDEDIDDKRNDAEDDEEEDEMVQRQRNAPLIRRGPTDSADDASNAHYESVVRDSVARQLADEDSLSIDEDDFSGSAVTVDGQDDDGDGAPFIGGRRLAASEGDDPDLAAAILDAQREANINAARAQQQNLRQVNDDENREALQQHANPLIFNRADIFYELTKHMGADQFKRPTPRHVDTIDASYVMNGDFGDAKQMELNKAITGNEEGGVNRTEHHLMRSRIFYGACQEIAQIEDAVERTIARLQMSFRGTAEYRNKCGSSVSNISDPMKLINMWFEDRKREFKARYGGEYRFCEETLSLFAMTQVGKLIAFEQFCFVYTAHAEINTALICALTAYRYLFGLRLHPLFHGPAGSSKSEVLTLLQLLLIKNTVEAVTNESQQADATDENENDVIRILHELPAAWVTKAQADAQKIEGLKNQMTAGISTRVVLDIGNGQRKRVYVTSEKQIVYCAASNLDDDALEKAVRDRFLLFHQVKRNRPDCTIDQKIANALNASHATKKARQVFEHNIRMTQYNFAHAEKFIMIGTICRPSIVVTPIVAARYMQALEHCSGVRGDRRLSDKILSIARVLTIEAAITWVYRSPMSPCYNKEVDLWYLLAAEPWMKDTEEIAMYAIDVARSQCINPDQEQFFYACRTWVMPKHTETCLAETKALCLFPQNGETIFEVNNAHHKMFRRWHYDYNQSGINYTVNQQTMIRHYKKFDKRHNQQHSIEGTQILSSSHHIASVAANGVADAVQRYTVEAAAAMKNPATSVNVESSHLQHGVGVMAAAEAAAQAEQYQISGEEEARLKAIDKAIAEGKIPPPQPTPRMQTYNNVADSVAEQHRRRHQNNAVTAEYNLQYVSFQGTLTGFAAQVAFQNSNNKGARETNVAAIEKLCRRLATCKIMSKLYIPNPESYDPPVILDESSEPTLQDMVMLPADNSCVYIHSSLVIGEYQDPHEIALRACASVFTPTARYISALQTDPSKPHIVKVRDVKPNDRTNFTFTIDRMSRQAELLGFAREIAVVQGTEQDADDVELDEDKMRAEKAIDADANSQKMIYMSLDDFATQEHLKSLGMPVTPRNMNFFNARINDNAARKISGATVRKPMKYPDDLLDTLEASKAKQEELAREFTGLSLSDLNLKRTRFEANILGIQYDADEEVADSITPMYENWHKLCERDRDVEQKNLMVANALMAKRSTKSLTRSSTGGLITPEVSNSGFGQRQQQLSAATTASTSTNSNRLGIATSTSTTTTAMQTDQTFRVPTGIQRKMRKTLRPTTSTATTTQNDPKPTAAAAAAAAVAQNSAMSSCESTDISQTPLDRMIQSVNASLAPIADPLMPRLRNTQHFIDYENTMQADDDSNDVTTNLYDAMLNDSRNGLEPSPLYD